VLLVIIMISIPIYLLNNLIRFISCSACLTLCDVAVVAAAAADDDGDDGGGGW